jgi:hypothetical protein
VFAVSELEQHLPRQARRRMLSAVYTDFVAMYGRMAHAAVIIQACVRGWRVRRLAATMKGGRARAWPRHVRSWRGTCAWRNMECDADRGMCGAAAAAKQHGGGGVGSSARGALDPISPRPARREARMLQVFVEMQRVLLAARGDANAASDAQQAVTVLRHAVLDPLRAQIVGAMRVANEDMQRWRVTADAVLRSLAPSTHDDGVQTMPIRE